MPERVELSVLGQKFTVRTDAAPGYLQELARYVDERAGALQRSGVHDPLSALALAAIEIADELHRAREDQTRDAGDVQRRLDALVDLLHRVAPADR